MIVLTPGQETTTALVVATALIIWFAVTCIREARR